MIVTGIELTGIDVLNKLIYSFDIESGTRFKLVKESGETPFLDKNKILHTDGKSLYNELGEAPTIDLILNYEFEIIEEPKEDEFEDIEKINKYDFTNLEIINVLNKLIRNQDKIIKKIKEEK